MDQQKETIKEGIEETELDSLAATLTTKSLSTLIKKLKDGERITVISKDCIYEFYCVKMDNHIVPPHLRR